MKKRYYNILLIFNAVLLLISAGCGQGGAFDVTKEANSKYTCGEIGLWSGTTSFANARGGLSNVVYNGYLYIIGGVSVSGSTVTDYNDVQYAPINADGTVGTWSATASFISGRSGHTSVVYNGYLYLLGGVNNGSTTYYNVVQYAKINANGSLGSWASTTSFANGRSGLASVVNNGYLYILGGSYYNGGTMTYYSDVQYAKINSNGTLGSWASTTSFANSRSGHASVVYNDYLYILGGLYNGNTTYYNDVQYAKIDSNGTLGSWASTTSFANGRSGLPSVVNNGYLYILGGTYYNGSTAEFYCDTQYAPINADGTIGTWSATTSFANARAGFGSVVYNDCLYILGGYYNAGGFSFFNDVQYAKICP